MVPSNQMPYHLGIKLHIRPDKRQQHIVAVNDGVRRGVYNKIVALENERFQLRKVGTYLKPVADRLDYINTVLSSKMELKKVLPWLTEKEVDSCAIDNAWRNHANAWKHFREDHTAGIPSFKKKSYEQHYDTNAQYVKTAASWDESNVKFIYFGKERFPHHIQLPILGCVKFQCSKETRDLMLSHKNDTRIGTIKVMRDNCGDYSVTLQFHSMTPFCDKLPDTGRFVGIDLNLTNLYSDSDGNVVDNPRFGRAVKDKLSKSQHKLSRRYERAKAEKRSVYRSSNYQEQRLKTAKLQRKTSFCREDYLNVKAKDLIKSHDLIVSEDLKVKSLMKNHCLAYSIADVSWGRFMELIDTKAKMYGRTYIKVPPQYTTQTCSVCGHVMKDEEHILLGVGEWICPSCGTLHKRDVNAAVNILSKAI